MVREEVEEPLITFSFMGIELGEEALLALRDDFFFVLVSLLLLNVVLEIESIENEEEDREEEEVEGSKHFKCLADKLVLFVGLVKFELIIGLCG